MPAGLDVGASRIVAATGDGVASEANAVQAVEDSEYVEGFLEGEDTLSVSGDGAAYAIGDAAPEVAAIVNDQPARLFGADAALPEDVLPDATAAVLRALAGEGDGPLRYVPAPDSDPNAVEDAARDLGYDPAPLDPGMAVLYDGLDAPHTGLGVVVDGARTVATLAVEGVPVATTELARGADWIDREVASATGKAPDEVAAMRADAKLDDPDAGGLALRYDTLLSNLALGLADEAPAVDGTVPVVVAGPAAPQGIDERLGDALADVALPFEVGAIERPEAAGEAAARGALVAAESGGEILADASESAVPVAGVAAEFADADGAEAALGAVATAGTSAVAEADAAGASDTGPAGGSGGAGGAGGSVGSDPFETEEPVGERTADPSRSTAQRPKGSRSPGAGSARSGEDGPEDDLFQYTSEILEELRDRLEHLEARMDVDGERPLDETVADLADDVAELAALETALESAREGLADLEDEVEGLPTEQRVEALESRLQALPPVADLAELAERVDRLDVEELDELADQLDAMREDRASVEARLDSLEADVDAVESTVESVESEVDAVAGDVDALDADVDDHDDRIGLLDDRTEELAALDQPVTEVAASLEEVEDAVAGLEASLEGLESDVERVDDGLDSVESEVTAVRDDVDVVEDQVSTVETELEDATETVATLEATVEDLAGDVERVGELSGRLADLETELEDALDGTAEAETVDALRERLDVVETAAEDAEDAVEDVPDEQDVEDIREDLADVTRRLDDLSETVAEDEEVEAISVDVEALRNRLEEFEDDVAGEIDELEGAIETRHKDAADAEELAAVETDVATLESTVIDVQDAIGGIQEEIATLRDDRDVSVSELQEELQAIRAQLEAVPEDAVAKEQYSSSVKRLEGRIGELETSLSNVENEANARAGSGAILMLGLGLIGVGGIGAGQAYLGGELEMAAAFVAVPFVVTLLAWYLS